MTAAMWLVLDNLKSGWPATTSVPRDLYVEALSACEAKGYVRHGDLTAAGEIALIANRIVKEVVK